MTDDTRHVHLSPQTPTANAALQRLNVLVGTWEVTLVFPTDPPGTVRGEATFTWLEDGAFLIERWGGSTWVIGPDESSESYGVLYHDERGVSRVYQMSLREGVWRIWRESPGFWQRFEGHLSADNTSITASWQTSSDGSQWEHDFELTYTKVTDATDDSRQGT